VYQERRKYIFVIKATEVVLIMVVIAFCHSSSAVIPMAQEYGARVPPLELG